MNIDAPITSLPKPENVYVRICDCFSLLCLFDHLGLHKVLGLFRPKYYCPQMRLYVSNSLRACQSYQSFKAPHRPAPSLLQPISVQFPFQMVSWDIIGPFPESPSGTKYIVVLTKYLTRWCKARALPDATATTVAKFLIEDLVVRHSCPQHLLSDQGQQFKWDVL